VRADALVRATVDVVVVVVVDGDVDIDGGLDERLLTSSARMCQPDALI